MKGCLAIYTTAIIEEFHELINLCQFKSREMTIIVVEFWNNNAR